jgi:NAD(P)-dependent dehydrogenase (short-subunit alcohol dehydrogenase family)
VFQHKALEIILQRQVFQRVVTGGAAGIGAAIAEELGRSGAFVVTVDPRLTLDGSTLLDDTAEPTTADRIVAAGGQARASNTSVTDGAAVQALFTALVEEFGSLDAVVNVAGISRPTGFALGKEDDWAAVLDVHLNGYLNCCARRCRSWPWPGTAASSA